VIELPTKKFQVGLTPAVFNELNPLESTDQPDLIVEEKLIVIWFVFPLEVTFKL
jgi:hypothetical protein